MYIEVDWDDPRPVYQQLSDQIVERIAAGDIVPGTTLPSVRRLAGELGVNLHTVHKAFEFLHRAGFVRLQPRFGAVVRSHPIATPDGSRPLRQDLAPLLARAWLQGLRREDIIHEVDLVLERFRASPAQPLPEEGA